MYTRPIQHGQRLKVKQTLFYLAVDIKANNKKNV